MKKLLLTALAFCILQTTQAQIKLDESKTVTIIGEIKKFGALVANISCQSNGKDTIYTLTFNDAQYQTLNDYKTVAFKETGNVLNQLYDTFKAALDKEETNLTLGGNSISIRSMKQMGVKYITVLVDNNGYFYLTEKQINRLFNR